MTTGKYPKGIAKSEEILETALQLVAKMGYSRTTIRELAEAVGLSKTGLLHHFGSKEALYTELLRRRDVLDAARFTEAAASEAGFRLPDLATGAMAEPGLIELYTRFSAEATEQDHAAHEFFQERYANLRERIGHAVERYQEEGTLPSHLDPRTVATIFIAMYDGLQAQWLFDPTIDMTDLLGQFFSLIAPSQSADGTKTGEPA